MEVQRKAVTRIIDIALQAGVSTATVDRVLNGRPGVRQKTIDRVRDAVHALDMASARPTVIPSLATDATIDVLIAGSAGFANDGLSRELRRAASEHGISMRSAYPQRLDVPALVAELKSSIGRGSSGVVVQALEHPTVREAVDELAGLEIPVVYILTGLPDSRALGYVGLDNRAAGRTSGLLMGRLCRSPGEVAIFLGGHLYRSHEDREMGFRTILREEFPELNILEGLSGLDDPGKNYKMAKRLFETRNSLVGIYSIGGGNRGIEKALLESGRKSEITYIAYNLTPLTRQALISGVMDAVVHQDMARVADAAVGALVNHNVGKPVSIGRIPVEIIMRENIRETSPQ